ncbi:hypothetical protein V1514DRAFT_351068 [Lipomyces japonicus]|uniref:uncharacterized protein n=1 Tax=Lipomyces japonicus TaxID=56871 RepID=UPI0034D013DF
MAIGFLNRFKNSLNIKTGKIQTDIATPAVPANEHLKPAFGTTVNNNALNAARATPTETFENYLSESLITNVGPRKVVKHSRAHYDDVPIKPVRQLQRGPQVVSIANPDTIQPTENHNAEHFQAPSLQSRPRPQSEAPISNALRALKVRSVDLLNPRPRLKFVYEQTDDRRQVDTLTKHVHESRGLKVKSMYVDDVADNLDPHDLRVVLERDLRRMESIDFGWPAAVEETHWNEVSSKQPTRHRSSHTTPWPWRDSRDIGHSQETNRDSELSQAYDNMLQDPGLSICDDVENENRRKEDEDREPVKDMLVSRPSLNSLPIPPKNPKRRSQKNLRKGQNSSHQSSFDERYEHGPRSGDALTEAWTTFLKKATAERIRKEQEERMRLEHGEQTYDDDDDDDDDDYKFILDNKRTRRDSRRSFSSGAHHEHDFTSRRRYDVFDSGHNKENTHDSQYQDMTPRQPSGQIKPIVFQETYSKRNSTSYSSASFADENSDYYSESYGFNEYNVPQRAYIVRQSNIEEGLAVEVV